MEKNQAEKASVLEKTMLTQGPFEQNPGGSPTPQSRKHSELINDETKTFANH